MTTTTTDRSAELTALLARLDGKVSDPVAVVGRLCEIRRNVPAKWDRFVAGAAANMPQLTADDIAAIIAYVAA